VVHMTVFL